ncbi:MAG: helix-turn-helix transcriptional regulator [bacterium]|nr:helix-turn-helix transcriptional regulator [bacterium]
MAKRKRETKTKEDIGRRFRKFREYVGRAQHEMATDLGVSQSTIANIERGKAFPNINYLHYFYGEYNLNVNWLLTAEGEMVSTVEGVSPKYSELLELMRIPVIEQVILARLVELKALLKDEIKTFQEQENAPADT